MFSFHIFIFYPSREVSQLKWTCFAVTQVLYTNFEKIYLCALSYKINFLTYLMNRKSVNPVEIPDQMEDKENRFKNMSISDENM